MVSLAGTNFTSNGGCTAGLPKTWMPLAEDGKAILNITT
jgi:hypothetical protein